MMVVADNRARSNSVESSIGIRMPGLKVGGHV